MQSFASAYHSRDSTDAHRGNTESRARGGRLGQGEAVESCGSLFRAVVPPGADPGNTELWQVSDIAVLQLSEDVRSTNQPEIARAESEVRRDR
jgi:hypothetical protein